MTMEPTSIYLSVVIVSYENWQVLKGCLSSIRRYNDIGDCLEVVVVEQSSTEHISRLVKREFPWVKLIRNENKGFGAGNNYGVKSAQGKYLLLLNPDTLLVEPLFEFAVKQFETNSRLGLFGVRLLDASGRHNRSFHFRKPYGLQRALLWRLFDRFNIFISGSMYISGADMFLRRDAFEKAGMFDERIFMYYEETDLAYRLESLGFEIGFYPEKRLIHLEGRCSDDAKTIARQLNSLKIMCSNCGLNYSLVLKKRLQTCRHKSLIKRSDAQLNGEIVILERELKKNQKEV